MMKTIVMVWNSQNEKEEFLAQISQKVKKLYDCEKIDVCTFDEDEINKIFWLEFVPTAKASLLY